MQVQETSFQKGLLNLRRKNDKNCINNVLGTIFVFFLAP